MHFFTAANIKFKSQRARLGLLRTKKYTLRDNTSRMINFAIDFLTQARKLIFYSAAPSFAM